MENLTIILDKKDLTNLVRGSLPFGNAMSHPLIKDCGDYTGGFHDKWTWKCCFEENLSAETLMKMYKICKDSWK